MKKALGKINVVLISKEFSYLLIFSSFLLYLRQYLTNRSLWLDEAAVTLNIIHLPISNFLHQPLPIYKQVAPFGFLAVEKIFTCIGGPSEYVLRILPLFASWASVCLFWRMSKIYLKDIFANLAVLSFIIIPSLVYYSSEVKPYAIDVFLTLLCYVLILPSLESKLTLPKCMLISLLGATMLWLSFPVIFVLAGFCATILGFSFIHKDKMLKLCSILLGWFLSLVLLYNTILHGLYATKSKESFWQFGYVNFTDPYSCITILKNILIYPLGISNFSYLAGLFLLIGAYSFFRENKQRFFYLLTPIFLVFCASGLHLYPLKDRLTLFMIPILLILIINGMNTFTAKAGSYKTLLAILCVGLLFYPSLRTSTLNLMHPTGKEEIKDVLSFVKNHLEDHDVLYISDRSIAAFEYYKTSYYFPPDRYIEENNLKDQNQGLKEDLRKISKFKRIWIIYSHYYHNANTTADLLLKILAQLNSKLLTTFKTPDNFYNQGAKAYLFDLSQLKYQSL